MYLTALIDSGDTMDKRKRGTHPVREARGRSSVAQISDDTILAMDSRNRDDIAELKDGQGKIHEVMVEMRETLARMDERLSDQKDIRAAVNSLNMQVNSSKRVAAVLFAVAELAIHALPAAVKVLVKALG
jgi:hypothetical protein